MILTETQQKAALQATSLLHSNRGNHVILRLPLGCGRTGIESAIMRNFSNPVFVSNIREVRKQMEDVSERMGRKIPTRSPRGDLSGFDLVMFSTDVHPSSWPDVHGAIIYSC